MTLLILLLGLALLVVVAIAVNRESREARDQRVLLEDRLQTLAPSLPETPAGQAVWLGRIIARAPPGMRRTLHRADVTITLRPLLIYAGALIALVGLAAWHWSGAVAPLVVLAIGLVLPPFYFQRLAAKRMQTFVDLLPHYLDSIRQLLTVGNSFQQALVKSTDNAGPAIQRYLQPAMRRIRNGAPVPEALDTIAERINLAELHMVVATVRTNARFGGSIGPTLLGLVNLLRSRARVLRELSAASSETRMSAIILCALPPIAMLLISIVNFSYMKYLWETEHGRHLLMFGVAFQVIGMLTMRRIMRLDF